MSDLSILYLYVSEGCSDEEIVAYVATCSHSLRRMVREALAGIREEARSPMQTNERVG